MKRFIALLLTLILAISLCACGKNDAEKYVGTWIIENATDDYGDLASFRLLKDGRAIYREYGGGEINPVTDYSSAWDGEWVKDENRILLFTVDRSGTDNAVLIFQISETGNLECDGDTYKKCS